MTSARTPLTLWQWSALVALVEQTARQAVVARATTWRVPEALTWHALRALVARDYDLHDLYDADQWRELKTRYLAITDHWTV